MWKKLLSHTHPPPPTSLPRPGLVYRAGCWPGRASPSLQGLRSVEACGAPPEPPWQGFVYVIQPSPRQTRSRRGAQSGLLVLHAARGAGLQPGGRESRPSDQRPAQAAVLIPLRAWCRPRPSPSWVGHSESGPSGWGGLHSGAQMLVRTCARPKPRSPRPSVGPQTPREEGLRGDAVTCKATCQPGRGGRRASGFVRSRRSGAVRIPEAWWEEGLCREGTGRTGQLLLRDEPPPRARGFANSRRSWRAASRSGLDSAPQATRTSSPSPRAHLRSPAGQRGGCAPGQTGLVRLETPKTGGEIDLAFGGWACGVIPGSRGVRRRGCGHRHSLPLRV